MTDSWVGGDIGGLRVMGETYMNAQQQLEGVIKPLEHAVDTLASDTGWKGEAASSFRGAWSEDAMTAGAFAQLVHDTGNILNNLANSLDTVETALKNAEDVATQAGVPMHGNGVPGEIATGSSPTAAQSKAIAALKEYATVRQELLHAAQQARLQAADQLNALYAQATGSVSPGDKATIADYLRGLYAYDAEDARAGGKEARAKLDDARKEADQAKKALRKERKALQAEGRSLPKDFAPKDAYRNAMATVDDLETKLARAENGSTAMPYDRALNVKVEDAAKALRLGEGVDKLPEFLKEMPVLDVAAAGACGILEAQQDHDQGWSWTHSVVVDGGANVGGLVLGTAITAGAVAALPVEVPTAVVAGVGGAVVIGATGVLDHAFHEHWREDIHKNGYVMGVLDGTGDVFKQTGGDFKRLGEDVWGGIKSIF
ncbi:WXG100 family type VII secretion target [Streptomyces sp. RPT161]|uniref:WXG100 family type VII secretion target n=1 Tax=Streptomyces sp. RPT161 TaxID=3015993 RepID=UPI0022B8EEF0|nr:hypothetical protein [Streptomyces sp. RPT161]